MLLALFICEFVEGIHTLKNKVFLLQCLACCTYSHCLIRSESDYGIPIYIELEGCAKLSLEVKKITTALKVNSFPLLSKMQSYLWIPFYYLSLTKGTHGQLDLRSFEI
jgi:hypothetical protein